MSNQPVVIDNGSGVLKAGFAGDEQPKTILNSHVGHPKHVPLMAGANKDDHFIGSKATELRGLLKLDWPVEHGIVRNWAGMEQIWTQAYEELDVQSEEHPVLLTEAPLNPRQNKEKAAEIFFETFNVPALYVSIQAVLSLYAAGRTTGLVLDSGDGVSHCVPIYNGFALPNAITRSDLAGRDVTEHLQLLLRKSGHIFSTTAEKEVVRDIKEKLGYIAYDPQKEEDKMDTTKTKAEYTLPDGTKIQVGAERFRAPEILFNPSLVGSEFPSLPESVQLSINRCDLDLRSTFYSNIVLSGGSTLYPGLGDRLLKEVKLQRPSEDLKIKIVAPQDRQLSPWLGGSILASLGTFQNIWVSHEEWEEGGASALHRKTF